MRSLLAVGFAFALGCASGQEAPEPLEARISDETAVTTLETSFDELRPYLAAHLWFDEHGYDGRIAHVRVCRAGEGLENPDPLLDATAYGLLRQSLPALNPLIREYARSGSESTDSYTAAREAFLHILDDERFTAELCGSEQRLNRLISFLVQDRVMTGGPPVPGTLFYVQTRELNPEKTVRPFDPIPGAFYIRACPSPD